MHYCERHVIKPSHKFYSECDQLCLKSKNLFNIVQYSVRQSFFYGHSVPTHAQLNKHYKSSEHYTALPAKVAQLVIKQISDSWKAYFEADSKYKVDPSKFTGRPKPPSYAHKRNLVKYNYQAISKTKFKKTRKVNPSKTNIFIGVSARRHFDSIQELRIVPRIGCYIIELVYNVSDEIKAQTSDITAAIDLGLDNLATVVFNKPELQPFIINGKPLKSVNQLWNKQNAHGRRLLPFGHKTSKKLEYITRNRNNYVDTYIHTSTKVIIDECLKVGVSKLIIGKNDDWKRHVNLGKVNNQKFVQIPYKKFVDRLTYKLKNVGIEVIKSEESYTSIASFLDWDIIPTYNPNVKAKYNFSGKRIKRAWYKSATGALIHADVNAAFNIGRKVVPNDFALLEQLVRKDRGCLVVHPRRITPISKRVHAEVGVA
jgi:IS605 OrfB family transposase